MENYHNHQTAVSLCNLNVWRRLQIGSLLLLLLKFCFHEMFSLSDLRSFVRIVNILIFATCFIRHEFRVVCLLRPNRACIKRCNEEPLSSILEQLKSQRED